MARGKKWISLRTPTEHRLFVQALDDKQRTRSAAGKCIALRSTKNKTRQTAIHGEPQTKRFYDVARFIQE